MTRTGKDQHRRRAANLDVGCPRRQNDRYPPPLSLANMTVAESVKSAVGLADTTGTFLPAIGSLRSESEVMAEVVSGRLTDVAR